MRIDNLNADERRDQVLRQKANDVMAPLGSTAVSSPGNSTRFIGNESLKVLGSQLVSGWLIITGTLKVVGAFLLEGATTMTGNLVSSGTALFTGAFTSRGTTRFEGDTTQVGPFHITGDTDATGAFTTKGVTRLEGDTTQQGPLHVVGATDFTGTVLIDGLTTLKKRLTVTAPGDIRVGGTIPMTIGDAKVGFDSGGSVLGYANGVRVDSGGAPDVVVSTGGVSLTGVSGAFLTVAGGVRTGGAVNFGNLPSISASGRTPNVWRNPDTGDVFQLV